jgi:hypothetical protein
VIARCCRSLAGRAAARRNRGPHGRRPAPEPRYDALRVVLRKGGRRDALAINPQTAARLRAYLELAGHGADLDGPMFRLLRPSGKRQEERRPMDPDAIDRVVRKFATALGLNRGCRRTRCAPPSSPRHWKTAPSSKMCKRPPAIVIPARRNCTIGAAIIPRGRRRSSRPTDSSVLTAAQLRARRFDFVDNPELPMLAAHHTICWEIRA